MKVTFDKDGYVEMLIKKGDLPNSTELEDDDSIDMNYLACYKLGYDGSKLVLDAAKVQRIANNAKAEELVYHLKKQLNESDYKVLRHIRETALGIKTTMNEAEYINLEAQRESAARKIREIEQGTKLETNVYAIISEGAKKETPQVEVEPVVEVIEEPKVEEVTEEKPKKKTTKKKSTKKEEITTAQAETATKE